MSGSEEKTPKTSAHYADLGLRFAISIGLCTWGGYWLDSKISTAPVFLILGLFLGATAGFVALYRAVYPQGTGKAKKGE